METKDMIQALIDKARAAQAILAKADQETVDNYAKAIGMAIFDAAEMLSKEAVEETHYGLVSDKIGKHKGVTTATWWGIYNKPSVGILVDNKETEGIIEYAKPMGVVASITPVTNPTTTATTNAMNAIKTGNAIIVCPHPGAKKCSAHACQIMNDTIVSLGGPDGLVQCVTEPSIEATALAMAMTDVCVATGGPSMVSAAYSSGKPAYGVGQGNSQVIVGPDWTDYELMADKVMFSRMYDKGVPCTGEQTIHVPRDKRDEIMKAFVKMGAYELSEAETDIVRKNTFKPEGPINPKVVGQSAAGLAEFYGIKGCPEDARCLIVRTEKAGAVDPLNKEILAPFLRLLPYDTKEEAVENCRINYFLEGAGHTGGIWSNDTEFVEYAASMMPVSRYICNMPLLLASGSPVNLLGYNPTSSLGCGSWGGNSISENFYYKHLLNTTRLAYEVPGKKIYTDEEIWAMD